MDGAKQGDEAALRCVRILGERLGIGIANAINLYDPLEVVIGGGVSNAGDLLLDPATASRSGTCCPAWGPRRRSGSRATARAPACSARR